MVKTKQNSIISLCLILVLMVSALVGLFVPQKSVSAYANTAQAGTDYDKITLFEGTALKSDGLNALCKRLLKSSGNKTLDDIKATLQNDADHALNAGDFRDGTKGVVVSFGGYDWQVVYLTTTRDDKKRL